MGAMTLPDREPSSTQAFAADSLGAVQAPQVAGVQTHPLRFTGQPGEYFRIWIVNMALTVVTLGLYTPWARIRTRQYLYGHTWLDGQNFEYSARPIALLRGYLIVVAFFGLFTAAQELQFSGWQWVVGGLGALFALAYPWLVRQSMRFQARSTVYRGLPFRFSGSLGEAYVAYGVANLVSGLSGSLALPWAWFMQRRYQAQGLEYGTARGHFRGSLGPFYLIGLAGFALTLLGVALVAALAFGGVTLLGGLDGLDFEGLSSGLIIAIVGGYLALGLLYGLAWQYVRAASMHYVLNHFELGGVVRTGATFRPWRLVWIGVTNTLARIVSLGLLTPWAVIRTNRYLIGHIQVHSLTSLDDFSAAQSQSESALGEAATELLDINIGF